MGVFLADFRKNKDPGPFRAIMARKRSRVLCIIFFSESSSEQPVSLDNAGKLAYITIVNAN